MWYLTTVNSTLEGRPRENQGMLATPFPHSISHQPLVLPLVNLMTIGSLATCICSSGVEVVHITHVG